MRITIQLTPTVDDELDSCIIEIVLCTNLWLPYSYRRETLLLSGSQTHAKLLKEVTFTILVDITARGFQSARKSRAKLGDSQRIKSSISKHI